MIDENLIHKALSNPFRRDVLKWLKAPGEYFVQGYVDLGRGVPINAIHAHSGLSQSNVSAHVAVLIKAGLVVSTRVGQWAFLSRNEENIAAFLVQIGRHFIESAERVQFVR